MPARPNVADVIFLTEDKLKLVTFRVPLSENMTVEELSKEAFRRFKSCANYAALAAAMCRGAPSRPIKAAYVGESALFHSDPVASVVQLREEKIALILTCWFAHAKPSPQSALSTSHANTGPINNNFNHNNSCQTNNNGREVIGVSPYRRGMICQPSKPNQDIIQHINNAIHNSSNTQNSKHTCDNINSSSSSSSSNNINNVIRIDHSTSANDATMTDRPHYTSSATNTSPIVALDDRGAGVNRSLLDDAKDLDATSTDSSVWHKASSVSSVIRIKLLEKAANKQDSMDGLMEDSLGCLPPLASSGLLSEMDLTQNDNSTTVAFLDATTGPSCQTAPQPKEGGDPAKGMPSLPAASAAGVHSATSASTGGCKRPRDETATLGWGRDSDKWFPPNFCSDPEKMVRLMKKGKLKEKKSRPQTPKRHVAPQSHATQAHNVQAVPIDCESESGEETCRVLFERNDHKAEGPCSQKDELAKDKDAMNGEKKTNEALDASQTNANGARSLPPGWGPNAVLYFDPETYCSDPDRMLRELKKNRNKILKNKP